MTMQKAIPRLFLALIIAATAIWLAVNRNQLDVSEFEARIRGLGLLAPFAHVVLFAVGTVLFLPGALFGLAGGALFGPAWGTLVNLRSLARPAEANRILRQRSGWLSFTTAGACCSSAPQTSSSGCRWHAGSWCSRPLSASSTSTSC